MRFGRCGSPNLWQQVLQLQRQQRRHFWITMYGGSGPCNQICPSCDNTNPVFWKRQSKFIHVPMLWMFFRAFQWLWERCDSQSSARGPRGLGAGKSLRFEKRTTKKHQTVMSLMGPYKEKIMCVLVDSGPKSPAHVLTMSMFL